MLWHLECFCVLLENNGGTLEEREEGYRLICFPTVPKDQ